MKHSCLKSSESFYFRKRLTEVTPYFILSINDFEVWIRVNWCRRSWCATFYNRMSQIIHLYCILLFFLWQLVMHPCVFVSWSSMIRVCFPCWSPGGRLGEIYKGDQSTLIFYRNISFSMEDTETPFGTLVPAKLMGQTSTIIYSKPWAEVYKWTEVRLFFIEINLSVWRTRDAFLIPQSKPNIRNKSDYYIFKTVAWSIQVGRSTIIFYRNISFRMGYMETLFDTSAQAKHMGSKVNIIYSNRAIKKVSFNVSHILFFWSSNFCIFFQKK